MRSRSVWLAMVVAGATAACGGGKSGYPTASGGSSGGGSNPPPTGPSASSVSIVDYSFSPSADTIKVGTTVSWTNAGSVGHTVTADDGSFDSGQLASATGGGGYGGGTAGGSFSRVFGAAGTFAFHCSNHSSMTGTIIVTR